MADAALGLVDVVVEEDVALGISSSGKSRAIGCTSAEYDRPVRRSGGRGSRRGSRARRGSSGSGSCCRDGGLDLHLDAGERALDDLDEDRVDARPLGREPVAVLVGVGRPAGFTGASVAGWAWGAVVVWVASLVTRLPIASTRTVKPGWTGTVEPNSSMIAGPENVSPARRSGASRRRWRRSRPPRRSTPSRALAGARGDAGAYPRRPRSRGTGPRDRPDAGDAQVDPLDLLARVASEVVAVEGAVLGVEAVGDLGGIRLVDGARRGRDAHLEGLAEVAQVDGAHVAWRRARSPLRRGPARPCR